MNETNAKYAITMNVYNFIVITKYIMIPKISTIAREESNNRNNPTTKSALIEEAMNIYHNTTILTCMFNIK